MLHRNTAILKNYHKQVQQDATIQYYLNSKHSNLVNKPIEFFMRKRDALKIEKKDRKSVV
jgi:hypothetical protein